MSAAGNDSKSFSKLRCAYKIKWVVLLVDSWPHADMSLVKSTVDTCKARGVGKRRDCDVHRCP